MSGSATNQKKCQLDVQIYMTLKQSFAISYRFSFYVFIVHPTVGLAILVLPNSKLIFIGWECFHTYHLFLSLQFQPMVFQKHHERFAAWHNSWLQENVSSRAADLVQDWLTGEEDEEMVPCKTVCEISEIHGMTVTRYRVQYTRRASSP